MIQFTGLDVTHETRSAKNICIPEFIGHNCTNCWLGSASSPLAYSTTWTIKNATVYVLGSNIEVDISKLYMERDSLFL